MSPPKHTPQKAPQMPADTTDAERGAGGQVVRFDDHTDLSYGKAGYENPFFIAFAPGVTLVK